MPFVPTSAPISANPVWRSGLALFFLLLDNGLVRLVRINLYMPKSKTTTESESPRKTAPKGRWQLQTAKARFSELFRRARSEGPQLITRRDKEGVVMISDEQYQRLVGKAHQPQNLLQFFRESPLVGIELDLERDKDEGRDIEV